MADRQVEQDRPKSNWRVYSISGTGVLLTLLLVAAIVYFWEEIQRAQGYGYVGGFVVSILGGITIIPAPSFLVTFALGRVLNPIYVGLLSGLGEALGGITVYLTGASAGSMWSRFRSRGQPSEHYPSQRYGQILRLQSRFWSKGEAFYNRLVSWAGGRGGDWTVFVSSAMVFSPFYFAGLAAGTLRMGLLRFFLISWAGKTIKGLAVAYAGYWGLQFLAQWI